MSRLSIKQIIPAVTASVLLILPLPAVTAVNPDPQSAASAGIQYLANHQNSDGSISGFGGESEWSAEAVEAAGQTAATFAHNGSPSLIDFLKTDVPAPGTPTTTIERKIIAIAAAGQDATSFGGVNYDALLESQHVSGQIGDPVLLNDDIFGIIAIDAAHATQLQAEAQDGLTYLLAHQGADGGFSYTTASCAWCGSDNNDTAAAIIAMYAAQDLGLSASNLNAARNNALNYLLSTQQTDGGFAYDAFSPSDGSSTAWSLMALNAIGNSVAAQAGQARNWLLQDQNPDGGFSYGAYGTTNSDTYTTSHAVIALLSSTWLLRPAPLSPAPPPAVNSSSNSGPSSPENSSSVQAQSPQPNTQQPVPAAASAISTSTTTPVAGDTADNTPQPKTSTTQPAKKAAHPLVNTAKKLPGYTMYGAGLLILVALIWLVVEFTETPESEPNVE